MKLNNVDMFRLLPQFMRDDRNSQAFAYAIQSQLNKVALNIEHARIYSRIDSMDEELLDELAWQFNIPEYNHLYDIEVKRNLIKDCMITHYHRGTVGAMVKVVEDIFGDARLEEWFEYGGNPYHFRVRTRNSSVTDEMLQDLDRVIKETKNIRSHLEEVVVEMMETMNLYVGCRVQIIDEVKLTTENIT